MSEWFHEIVLWAKNHHEKVDGSGYPYSLLDENLDVGSKIVAFSDVIAALMEDRPYRKSLSVETAFEIIRKSISAKISDQMFAVIEGHKDEISAIVLQCQQNVRKQYSQDTAS